MSPRLTRLAPLAVVLALTGFALYVPTLASSQSGAPPQGGAQGAPPQGRAPMGPRPGWAAVDSFASDRDSMAKVVLERIAGREEQPAESVFKNIKVMKGVPAGRLVRIMNGGFGRSLGVGCEHCHVPGHWADEDKKQKQVARDMMAMVDTINRVLLPHIANLQSEQPHVNCGVCHRGAPRPGAEMGGPRPAGDRAPR